MVNRLEDDKILKSMLEAFDVNLPRISSNDISYDKIPIGTRVVLKIKINETNVWVKAILTTYTDSKCTCTYFDSTGKKVQIECLPKTDNHSENKENEFNIVEYYPSFGYNYNTGEHLDNVIPTKDNYLQVGRIIIHKLDPSTKYTVFTINAIYSFGLISVTGVTDKTKKAVRISDVQYSIDNSVGSPPIVPNVPVESHLLTTPPESVPIPFRNDNIKSVIKTLDLESPGLINELFTDNPVPLGTRVIFNPTADSNNYKIAILSAINKDGNVTSFDCKYIEESEESEESEEGEEVAGGNYDEILKGGDSNISEWNDVNHQPNCSTREKLNQSKFMIIEYYPTFGYDYTTGKHTDDVKSTASNFLYVGKKIYKTSGEIYSINDISNIYTNGTISCKYISGTIENIGTDENGVTVGTDANGETVVVGGTVGTIGTDVIVDISKTISTGGEYSVQKNPPSSNLALSNPPSSNPPVSGQLVRHGVSNSLSLDDILAHNNSLAELLSTNFKKHISIKDIKRGKITLNNVTSYFASHQSDFFSHNSDSNLITDNHIKFKLTLAMNYNEIENEDNLKKVIIEYIKGELELESSDVIHIDSLERGSVIIGITLNMNISKSELDIKLKEVVYPSNSGKKRRVSGIKVIEIKGDNEGTEETTTEHRLLNVRQGSRRRSSNIRQGSRNRPANRPANGEAERDYRSDYTYGVQVTNHNILMNISKVCGEYFRKVLFNFVVQAPLMASCSKKGDDYTQSAIVPDQINSNKDFTNFTTLYHDASQGAKGKSFGGDNWMTPVSNLLGCEHYMLSPDSPGRPRKIEDNKYMISHVITPGGNEKQISDKKLLLANVGASHWQYCVETNEKTSKTTEIVHTKSQDNKHIAYISRIINSGGDGNCYYNSIALYILYNVLDGMKDLPDASKDAYLINIYNSNNVNKILDLFKQIIKNQIQKLNLTDYKIDKDLSEEETNELTIKYKKESFTRDINKEFTEYTEGQKTSVLVLVQQLTNDIKPDTDIDKHVLQVIQTIHAKMIYSGLDDGVGRKKSPEIDAIISIMGRTSPNIIIAFIKKYKTLEGRRDAIYNKIVAYHNSDALLHKIKTLCSVNEHVLSVNEDFINAVYASIVRGFSKKINYLIDNGGFGVSDADEDKLVDKVIMQVIVDTARTQKTYTVSADRINELVKEDGLIFTTLNEYKQKGIDMKKLFTAIKTSSVNHWAPIQADMSITRTKITDQSYNSYSNMSISKDQLKLSNDDESKYKHTDDFMKWKEDGCYVNFANKNSRGGSYKGGAWAQEEQMLGLNPVSAIFTLDTPLKDGINDFIGDIKDGEIIEMKHVSMDYQVLKDGYDVRETDKWVHQINTGKPMSRDTPKLLEHNPEVVNIYTIDFQYFDKTGTPYTLNELKFCFHKSLSMMCKARESGFETITTGLIGAGAFNGSSHISLLIQILAAELIGIKLIFTAITQKIATAYNMIINSLLPNREHLTVEDLLNEIVGNPFFSR